jgi:hypothetical protein
VFIGKVLIKGLFGYTGTAGYVIHSYGLETILAEHFY